jgi:cellulose synthase/poly-beta-1,6-N-acetylglucosamine synthase-like glycosyltransferase
LETLASIIAALLVVSLAQSVAVVMLSDKPRSTRHRKSESIAVHAVCFGVAGSGSFALGSTPQIAATAAGTATAVSMLAGRHLTGYRPVGTVFLMTSVCVAVLSVIWAVAFVAYVAGQGVSTMTLGLVAAGSIVGVVSLPSDVLSEVMRWEVLLRAKWRRTRTVARHHRPGFTPMVSVQVPIHAEPPEIVINTLDALSKLSYPNYEVIVVDNNTSDENLWRPVEEHCARLGPQFRFLHVEGIKGAKAGALNWARPRTDPRAELLGVVDADYVVDPDWLAHTVGYFEEATVGFVQCPHAYRDFESSAFTKMANAEYSLFFAADMIGLDEHGAGITVGTMSVIRLASLDQAGGWAEWCMTEDSELAIRIHARGYKSVYLERPYGWGLIPETWEGYKKQRFRWTYGPVQEFVAHASLFIPGRKRKPSALLPGQRIHHANHGLAIALSGIRFLGLALVPLTLLSISLNDDLWPVPTAWVLPFMVILVNRQILRWIIYRRVLRFSLADIAGASIAQRALSYTVGNAAFRALCRRPTAWKRTNKFSQSQSRMQVFSSAGTETVLAVVSLGFAILSITALPFGVISSIVALSFVSQACTFAAAPALSYLADSETRKLRSTSGFLPSGFVTDGPR